jgi:transposase InsO family protein
MPWKTTSLMDERIKFVILASQAGANLSQLCAWFGISRPTGYRWLSRYGATGSVASLENRSRRPRHSPGRTPDEIEARVVALRQEYGWGAKKLRELLGQEHRAVPCATINRILKRHGLIEPIVRDRGATTRFERARPNELWQMDFKGEFVRGRERCYPLTLVDDHSRFALGVFALPNLRAAGVQPCVRQTFVAYGLPEAMLMDHGCPWWSTTNAYGLTSLSVWLIKQGIRLIWSGIRHPQTQGKVERFHRTLKHDVLRQGQPETLADWQRAFDRFRHRYNHIRPHESLAMGVPADRYLGSSRQYQSRIPEWTYPAGATVKRLSTHGCLPYGSRYYFVCEALAHEWVRLEQLPDRLLVSYRHMYIREIALDTGVTKPLVIPVTHNGGV